METALQQLGKKIANSGQVVLGVKMIDMATVLKIIDSYIPTEQLQIEKAYDDAMEMEFTNVPTASDYYTQTYQSK